MKKYILFIFTGAALFGAQTPIYMAPPANLPTAKKETKEKKTPSSPATIIAGAENKSNEVMIISPGMRAGDIKTTIEYLKEKSPATTPVVILKNGKKIGGIANVDVMPGGTILIFRISSLKGIQYKVVKIEEIDTLSNESPS